MSAPVVIPARRQLEIKSLDTLQKKGLSQDYLIKGVIEPGTLNVIYGEPSCGKSFLGLHLTYRGISLGRSVFGRRVREAPVMYVALEGELGFERRLTAAVAKWLASGNFFYVTGSVDLFAGLGDVEA